MFRRPSPLWLEAAIAVALFGCIPVVVRSVSANPYTIGLVRLAVATAGVAVLVRARAARWRLRPRDLGGLALIGVLFASHWLTYFTSIKLSSAAVGAIGLSTYGVHLLILGWIFQRQRPRALDALAVLLSMSGTVLVVPTLDLGNDVTAGMAIGVLSGLIYATLPILHQRYAYLEGALRTLGQFAFGLAFFGLFAGQTSWDLTARDWAGLAFLAVGPTLIAHSLWVRVTTLLPPATTSVVYYGNVPIALLLSATVLHEAISIRMLAGAALVVAGSLLGVLRRREQTP